MARILAATDAVLGAVLRAALATGLWLDRHQARIDRFAAFLLELSAFLLLTSLVGRVAGTSWALLPLAAYALLQSIALRRRADRSRR